MVVGKKENIQRIIDEVQKMQIMLKEVAGQLQSGNFSLAGESYEEMKADFLATAITLVDILDGAAYLLDKERSNISRVEQKQKMLADCRRALNCVKGTDKDTEQKND